MKKLFSLFICLILLSGCFFNDYIGEIYLFLPGEYINEEVVEQFEYEYHIKVNIDTFDSNESMYTKLLGGAVYDVVIPSDYMIEKLIQEEMLEEIDKSLITNYNQLNESVLFQDFDYDNKYSIPYFWGNVGIVYDQTVVDEEDVLNEQWEVLRNPKYKGIIYMYDNSKDSFMIPLKMLGYSMNSKNLDEVQKAYEWLIEQNEIMDIAYVTDEAIDGLAYCTDGKYMGVMYSGDAAYILGENENMRYYAPEVGTNFWIDSMVILKNAKNKEYANMFINFMIDYDSQYDNSTYVGYCSVNEEVLRDLIAEDGDFADNEAYLPRERTEKDESNHSDDKMRVILAEYWIKVMNH